MSITIRDAHAVINGDKRTFRCISGGLQIIGDGGKTLFEISACENPDPNSFKIDSLRISTDSRVLIIPVASNVVIVSSYEDSE